MANAASFNRDLKAFARKVEQRQREMFTGCASEIQRSVVEGSEITAAPGQPVDTGNLRTSWVGEFTSDATWQTTTNVEYARHVEDNVNNVTFKNHGPHSVKLTRNGWQRIVAYVRSKVVR